MIIDIDSSLRDHDNKRKQMFKVLASPLERYKPRDFVRYHQTPKIIVQVREFKQKIEDTSSKLKGFEDMLVDLKEKLKTLQGDKKTKADEA